MAEKAADPDRKERPQSYSDLIVVNPPTEKYMIPASASVTSPTISEPNSPQSSRLGPSRSEAEEKHALEDATPRRRRRGLTAKKTIIILIIVLIIVIAVVGAVVGVIVKTRSHSEYSVSPAAKASTTPGTAHNMSGTATATGGYVYPTAVSPEPTTIHVLSVGSNASLYIRSQNISDNGSLDDWTSLGGTVSPGVVAAAARGPGLVNVFSRGTNGDLYQKYLINGSSWGPTAADWDDKKGQLQNAPEVISSGGQRLDVFSISDGNGLNVITTNSTNPADWGNWIPLGGQWSKTIMPTLVSWDKGRIDAFLVAPRNGLLYHRFLDPNATNWQPFYGFESLGGKLAGRPSAVSYTPGRIDVFGRGGDGGLWYLTLLNGSWSDWAWLGADIRGEPAVVSCGPSRLDVFVWGEDFKYYYKSFDGTKWTPGEGFNPLGNASFGGPPKVLSRANGIIDLFGYSSHGSVMHKAWSKALGGWAPDVPFDNWGSPG